MKLRVPGRAGKGIEVVLLAEIFRKSGKKIGFKAREENRFSAGLSEPLEKLNQNRTGLPRAEHRFRQTDAARTVKIEANGGMGHGHVYLKNGGLS